MKKLLLLIISLVSINQTIAQADAFIATWVTDTGFKTLTLPAQPDAPNYTINWGDGSTNTYTSTQVPSHLFINSGEHTISFTGTFTHLIFDGQTKLKAVQQWGNRKWTSMSAMFKDCTNLNIFPTQAPDLSLCTDMIGMFYGATAFNQPIGDWDVSKVINMRGIFWSATAFNQPIGDWNVSNVTSMQSMFKEATTFNQPIDSWDVSKVTDMISMFDSATAFNQPIDSWDVSNVTNMTWMFSASSFNQPIGTWNVSKVKDMRYMFVATTFNQPIGSWNVSNVTNMTRMFSASSFNQPIGTWNVSNVTDMSFMFSGAIAFNQPIDSWDVSKVTNMTWMFKEATTFNQPIGDWNVSNVTDMSFMFSGAIAFNQPIDSWDVSNVVSMQSMFLGVNAFNQPLGSWNLSNMNNMFDMFRGTTLSAANYDATLIGWATRAANGGALKSNVSFHGGNSKYCDGQGARNYLTNTYGWVIRDSGYDCTGIPQTVVLDNNGVTIKWTGTTVTSLRFIQASPRGTLEWFAIVDDNTKHHIKEYANSNSTIFKNYESSIPINIRPPIPFNNIVTTLVTDMKFMFYPDVSFNQPIDSWDVSNVTNMSYMFRQCGFNQPIGSWNVSKVKDMSQMFFGTPFNQPIDSWDVSNVTNMTWMFGASSFNQPIGTWNVSNVTNMENMFRSATAFNQPIGSWDVSNVTNMTWMFSASSFNQPIGTWNVSKVTNMENMFRQSGFNKPIDSWDVSNVTSFEEMFRDATSFNQPIGSWNISGVTEMTGMFDMFRGAKLSTANYDATLIGWATRAANGGNFKTYIKFSGGNSTYCNGANARTSLDNNYAWTITDGGLDCSSLNTQEFDIIGLKLYPNPVISILNVDNNLTNQPYNIIDTLGKVILKGNLNEGNNSINVEKLSKGIYYLKVLDKRARSFIKE
jgi:surface protein